MNIPSTHRDVPVAPAMRILILAPDEAPVRNLRASLEARGCGAAHVTTARDADAFLALWNTHAVVVPEGASPEVREMVASSPSRPVLLVLSGLTDGLAARSGSTARG